MSENDNDAKHTPMKSQKKTQKRVSRENHESAPSELADGNFRAAMQNVKPLATREYFIPQTTLKNVDSSDIRKKERTSDGVSFNIHRDGTRHWGHRADLPPKTLSRLQRGEIVVERKLDLHHFTEDDARKEVLKFLRTARDHGLRCVSIIHGRGLHSAGAPILKTSLIDWIEGDPGFAKLKREILAFTTAPPQRGRDGATLILFARKRR